MQNSGGYGKGGQLYIFLFFLRQDTGKLIGSMEVNVENEG